MSENSLSSSGTTQGRPDFNGKGSRATKTAFYVLLIAGLAFAGFNLFHDVEKLTRPSPVMCLSFCSAWRC